MSKPRQYLTRPAMEMVQAFIKNINVDTINDDKSDIILELMNNETIYQIGNIEASEHNVDLLWELYDTNTIIEVEMVNMQNYSILRVLGLYVAIIQINDNLWVDIDSLDLEDESEE